MNRTRRPGILFSLALAASFSLRAPAGDLATDMEELVARHKLGEAAVGVAAARGGKTLVERRCEETFPLASVTKVFTAVAAIEALGKDFQFETRLYVLPGGRLVVVGGGDPSISGREHEGNPLAVFEKWADALAKLNMGPIGSIELDDSRFDRVRIAPGWPRDQLTEWYAAPVGALALNDNCVDVKVAPGEAGQPVKITVSPPTAFVKIDNRCTTTTVAKEHVFSLSRRPGTNVIVVKGKFLATGAPWTESVTVEDPGMFFGEVLKETLVKKGVAAPDAAVARLEAPFLAPEGASPALTHRSPLAPSLRVMLVRSQNFYAEQFLRSLAPAPSSFESGAAAALRALAPLGVSPECLTLLDGCGLSRGNRASPATVALFLSAASSRPSFPLFFESLPAAGEGTLKDRLEGVPGVRGKTGTIAGVSNLAGYVDAPGGRVAFAILISGLKAGSAPARAFQEDFVKRLSKE